MYNVKCQGSKVAIQRLPVWSVNWFSNIIILQCSFYFCPFFVIIVLFSNSFRCCCTPWCPMLAYWNGCELAKANESINFFSLRRHPCRFRGPVVRGGLRRHTVEGHGSPPPSVPPFWGTGKLGTSPPVQSEASRNLNVGLCFVISTARSGQYVGAGNEYGTTTKPG